MVLKEKLPLITLVINNFNNIRYIDKAISSAINQTYKNLQIIILDDCSTNLEVFKIYEKYKKMDQRIEIHINKKNINLYASRLKAIDLIKGEYVCFMDGDDCYIEDFIRHMYFFLYYKKADIVCCSFTYMVEDEIFIDTRNKLGKVEYTKSDNIINFLFENKGATYSQNLIWNKLYKSELLFKAKELIKQYKLDDINLFASEDMFINLFVMNFANKLCIDENFVGNKYRRSEPIELKPYEVKINYIQGCHDIYTLIYKYFLKDITNKQSSNLYQNFYKTVINTFSQFLYLYKIDIKDLDLNRTKNYIDIKNDEHLMDIKEQVLVNSNQWLIPISVKYKNHIDKIKNKIKKANLISFSLKDGIFSFLNKSSVVSKDYLFDNDTVWDFLLYSLYLNKKIEVFYDPNNNTDLFLQKEFLQKLNDYGIIDTNIKFKKSTLINSKNFYIDKLEIKNYDSEYILQNSKFNKLINKAFKKDEELKQQAKKLFCFVYTLNNNYKNIYQNTVFNYSYDIFFQLFIALKLKFYKSTHDNYNSNYKKSVKILMLDVYSERTIPRRDIFFDFLNKTALKKMDYFYEKIQVIYPELINEKFANKMFDLFFDNLAFWYESTSCIPFELELLDKKINSYEKIEILKEWQKSKMPFLYFKNYKWGIYKIPFIREVKYLFTDMNIFNNEMYRFLHNHHKFFQLFWYINRKSIKK